MKKIISTFLILSSLIYANTNFVDVYRTQGIAEVEKLLNESLTKKDYWKKSLKDKNIQNGYYESVKFVILTNKGNSNIQIFNTQNNEQVFQSDIITGEKYGDKKLQGDLKTPLGVYSLTSKLSQKQNNLDKFYGPLALTTNYPNAFDKSYGKTGNGIWIHGFPLKEKRDPYTKGCIALKNDKLINLDSKIDFKKSILIISEEARKDSSKDEISSILAQIFQWRDAWKYSDLNKYLSFYSSEFKRADGTDIKKFKRYKQHIFNRKEKKKILFSDINIIPYPNDLKKTMFKVSMHEDYKTKNYTYIGSKELFVELIDNKMKILFE